MSLALLHSPAHVVKWLLINQGQASTPLTSSAPGAWPGYSGGEPAAPDEVITVYNTTESSDGRHMGDGERFRHWGIQLRVRSATDERGSAKTHGLQVFLDEQVYDTYVTLDAGNANQTTYLIHCFAKTGILVIARETPTSKRYLYTINTLLSMKRTA